MGEKIVLEVQKRTVHGKKVSKLRLEGIVPVVIYGADIEPITAQAPLQSIEKIVKEAGRNTPVYLTIDGKKRITMVKEINIDPVKNRIEHVAFHAVRQNQPIEAEVPIRLVGEGESEAEKSGLIVLQNIESLEVKALPLEMPESLEIDTRHLKEAGERVLVKDIQLPKNVELVERTDGRTEDDDEEEKPTIFDLVVASVWEPGALAAANESAAGDTETADASEVKTEKGSEDTAESEDKKAE